MDITLRFIPPNVPDQTTLVVYEAPTSAGPWTEIDTTTQVGLYPDYIFEYTSKLAVDNTHWFAIAWRDSTGAEGAMSDPIQGGTSTLVGELIERVMLRSPDLDEVIVSQEAEATVSFIYKTDNPYSIERSTVTPLWLTELANLALVAALYVVTTQNTARGQDYTAGMISERTTADSRALDNLERLERRALRRLGIGGSLLASIDTMQYATPVTGIKTSFDSSRLLEARAIITEHIAVRDVATGALISDDQQLIDLGNVVN